MAFRGTYLANRNLLSEFARLPTFIVGVYERHYFFFERTFSDQHHDVIFQFHGSQHRAQRQYFLFKTAVKKGRVRNTVVGFYIVWDVHRLSVENRHY